ncbi:TonB-dependent receptor [Xanthomonas nasturtii]|uniref:TonB-dependent receptor n=1 Tax=Xanthomonas nasturtii TaxID=1843581 RepID=A0ABT0LT57_9XANT|nr:TonB-dependent receptor [Xanthomonas nasturtii]MCL1525217.1 TonB-dependent receptor [Xanthomonas nasturtii]MCL1533203.1 TonB-dependent receptor [Xanthomonas nasturtii]MCL1542185.1 TonB-dependent receptor [Xanthomonas nasturtii]MCL1552530.1 TonB-dependent receptor [Xanthomonas nasturtii]MCL1555710.1 TonB-dependent receptor [Xanthomonas nasturtii]
MSTEHHRRGALALALFAVAHAAPLYAQTATQAGPEEPATLAALTVTAQKREESLQNVPVVVSVLPEQLLQDSGVHDIKELQVLVPGLIVTSSQSAAQTTARIRGIGTVGDNAGLESSVGVVIDGVARARNGVGFADLGELERIEVLKGPQGTVFGKNTSAGVISVVTRRPSFTRSADAEITVGNYGARGLAAAFNDALGDTSALRVYAARRQRDGFEQVVTGPGPRTAGDDGDQNLRTARVQLLWEPSDDLDINLAADYTTRDENCCVTVTTERGPTAALIDAVTPGGQGTIARADPQRRRAYSNRSTGQRIEDKGISAHVDWTTPWLGEAVLTSITAVRDWKSVNGLDFDYGTADILYRAPREDEMLTGFKTVSQELRLAGTSARVDWMVGAFYADETLHRNESYRFGTAYEPYLSSVLLARINPALAARADAPRFLADTTGLPAGTLFRGQGSQDRFRQDGRSIALFTNNTWHATDALDVLVGLRYTYENKALQSAFQNPDGSPACASYFAPNGQVSPLAVQRIGAALVARGVPASAVPAIAPQVIGFTCLPWANVAQAGRLTEQERTEREWSGTAKLAYRWNDALMTYVSAARGYKAGGFNLDRVQSSNGLSSGVQGILPVDDTAFPGEFVNSYELGAKTTWLGGNLLLNATLFYQDFSDFQLNNFLGTSFVVRAIPSVVSRGVDTELLWQGAVPGLMLQGGLSYTDTAYGDDPLPDADLALLPGSRLSFAPRWSANLSVTYEHALGNQLTSRFHLGAKYSSDYNAGTDLDPQKVQPGYTLLNARLGLGADNKRWLLEAWAENLTNETYRQVVIDAPLQAGSWNAFLGAPRTYGVTLRLRY